MAYCITFFEAKSDEHVVNRGFSHGMPTLCRICFYDKYRSYGYKLK